MYFFRVKGKWRATVEGKLGVSRAQGLLTLSALPSLLEGGQETSSMWFAPAGFPSATGRKSSPASLVNCENRWVVAR